MVQFTVKRSRTSKRFDVLRDGVVVEGGFFTRDAAEASATEWRKAYDPSLDSDEPVDLDRYRPENGR